MYCLQRYICCSPKRLRPFAIHSCIIVHFVFIIMYILFSSQLLNECTDIDKRDSYIDTSFARLPYGIIFCLTAKGRIR